MSTPLLIFFSQASYYSPGYPRCCCRDIQRFTKSFPPQKYLPTSHDQSCMEMKMEQFQRHSRSSTWYLPLVTLFQTFSLIRLHRLGGNLLLHNQKLSTEALERSTSKMCYNTYLPHLDYHLQKLQYPRTTHLKVFPQEGT